MNTYKNAALRGRWTSVGRGCCRSAGVPLRRFLSPTYRCIPYHFFRTPPASRGLFSVYLIESVPWGVVRGIPRKKTCPRPSPVRSGRHEPPHLLRLPVKGVRGRERQQQGVAAAARPIPRFLSSSSPCSSSSSSRRRRCCRRHRRSCCRSAPPSVVAVPPPPLLDARGGSVAALVRRSAVGNWRLRLRVPISPTGAHGGWRYSGTREQVGGGGGGERRQRPLPLSMCTAARLRFAGKFVPEPHFVRMYVCTAVAGNTIRRWKIDVCAGECRYIFIVCTYVLDVR